MKKYLFKNKAQGSTEIMVVLVLVIGAFLVFQKYFAQAIFGRWKGVGDSWSFGRQYDPDKTTECVYNTWGNSGEWYLSACFEEQCYAKCVGGLADPNDCDDCLNANCRSKLLDNDGNEIDVCNKLDLP